MAHIQTTLDGSVTSHSQCQQMEETFSDSDYSPGSLMIDMAGDSMYYIVVFFF